ncbi:hypothetical protein AGMMS50239_14140 [Bacteroidia bacterium]|nr:hypothetical protein AGMMS50239_14140 [Bacteroidia bacterium]
MKLIKYLFLFIPIIVITACVKDEETLFNDPPAIRMQKTIDEYKTLLTGSANGWIMDYYPEVSYAAGGFSMYYKFSADGNVDIACEIATNVPARQTVASTWDIIPYQGPVITFDTYNPVLHYFSEVSSTSDRDGRGGDYEFVVMKATQDTIYLKGLKNENKIVMWKAGSDPMDYLKQVSNTYNKANAYKNFNFELGGNIIGKVVMSSAITNDLLNRKFTASYTKNDKDTTETIAFIYTVEGIRLNTDLVVNGVSMRHFAYDDTERIFTCSDPGIKARFICTDKQVLKYEDFLGDYVMYYAVSNTATSSTRTLDVSLVAEKENISYCLEGLLATGSPGKILLQYSGGNLQLLGQIMYTAPETGYNFWLLPYSFPVAGSNYITQSTTVGMTSIDVDSSDGKVKFRMVNNGAWGTTYSVAGFLLRNYNGSTSLGNVNGKDGQPFYFFPIFEMK